MTISEAKRRLQKQLNEAEAKARQSEEKSASQDYEQGKADGLRQAMEAIKEAEPTPRQKAIAYEIIRQYAAWIVEGHYYLEDGLAELKEITEIYQAIRADLEAETGKGILEAKAELLDSIQEEGNE